MNSHRAGSDGDEALGNMVVEKFQDYNMKPWADAHYIKIQDLPRGDRNRVTFKNKTYSESGYLSYSANKSVQVCTNELIFFHLV